MEWQFPRRVQISSLERKPEILDHKIYSHLEMIKLNIFIITELF